MTYIHGDRQRMTFLPAAIDEYVGPKDPVRAYDAIIEAIDVMKLGLIIDPHKVGSPAYHPMAMLKLLVYGYSYGWRSSRKLERACYHDLSFIWLMGGVKPDHKTIANFRKGNADIIAKVLKQIARLCIEMDLIEGNCLFTDGTKIRASASIGQTKSREKWREKLAEVDERIDALLVECEKIDEEETGCLVETNELDDAKKMKNKIENLLSRMEHDGTQKINGTDADCRNFHGRQGSHAGYNAQITVDEKNGLIVSADVVSEPNDRHQFSNQVAQAIDTLEGPCRTAVADAGYSSVEDLKETVEKDIDVIVPSQRQSLRSKDEIPFEKSRFRYDSENDVYICPEGKRLRLSHYSEEKRRYVYRMAKPSFCLECAHYGVCTNSKRGRAVGRLRNEALRERLDARYSSEEGQALYKKRKEKVELPFGHIKQNLGCTAFLVRGISMVRAEFGLLASCFNIARMITLAGGVDSLISRLGVPKLCLTT